MNKLNKLTLKKVNIDTNSILRKKEMKSILGGYISCVVYHYDSNEWTYGDCAGPTASKCEEYCDQQGNICWCN